MSEEAARIGKAWGWSPSDVTIKNVMTHGEAGSGRDGWLPAVSKKPYNYGPSIWGGDGSRWDLDKLTPDQNIGDGGPIMRDKIKGYMAKFHEGGEVPGTGERMAKLLGGEVVVDVDSAEHKPVKNMLLAINKASTYEGVVNAIRKFAPYEALSPETITIPNPTQQVSSHQPGSGTKQISFIPVGGEDTSDPFEVLYKG